ncbi:MAG: hypothetical protein GTO17_10660 [Candidatus Aminicenantes bacterium]|nr:hypothetical protein [Candidatus Aminicenantes bacterium]
MESVKKGLFIALLIIIGALEAALYWNTHLYYQAKEKIENSHEKIEVLEKANLFYPFNDLVYYELGKAYFNLGVENIGRTDIRDAYLRESTENFTRSLAINPASPFSHFNFAQSLLYQTYAAPSSDLKYFEEYKKAAFLTGHHSQIFYEVGKILFSRWEWLSPEEREFTLEITKKILNRKWRETFRTLLPIWEMNVKDYEVMEKVLPEDPGAYRWYARFLGEKSLSSDVRQQKLALAEFLEFEKAKNTHTLGVNKWRYYQIQEACNHFKSALSLLKGINFYQDLVGQELIEPSEFDELQKSVYLNLLKCRVDGETSLDEIEEFLQSYLSLENKLVSVEELETYLIDRGLIEKRLEGSFEDLKRLYFQILFASRQSRYREIMRVGNLLQQSLVVVPEDQREDYRRILKLIGDAYLKSDYLYDAEKFYQKAYEIEPSNLETLFKMRRIYERLNEVRKVQAMNWRIRNLLPQREILVRGIAIEKGKRHSRRLVFDERKIMLVLQFRRSREGETPLISVYFNERIVWEDYLRDNFISIPLDTQIGENVLVISPVNRGVGLLKIQYR